MDLITKYSDFYCIVGSGIGGATIALKLAAQGKKVLIIEAGKKHSNNSNVNYENCGRDFGLRTTTSIQLGGTSNLWHGVLGMLDPIDFEKREWITYSGWPISFKDLLPYYEEAASIYKINNFSYFFEESLNIQLKEELSKIQFSKSHVKNKLFQQPLPAKRFKDDLLKLQKSNKEVNILLNHSALELITDEKGVNITEIIVGDNKGNLKKIKAKTFIIATGALETPRLLLNSNKFHKNGIGNLYDNVGRFLMDHPMGNLLQLQFKTATKASIYSDLIYAYKNKIKTGIILSDGAQKQYKLPNHNLYLRPSFVKGIDNESEKIKLAMLTFLSGKLNLKDVYKVITNINVVRQILTYKLTLNVKYKFADLFFITEQIPNPNSTITLSNNKDKFGYPIAKVKWEITKNELLIMNQWNRLIRGIFMEGYDFTHSNDDVEWNEIYTSAAHHVGTARMAERPEDGVVDKNLQVFGMQNLFICDGSVFTTSGNVNSGFTISALACRLAEFLKQEK